MLNLRPFKKKGSPIQRLKYLAFPFVFLFLTSCATFQYKVAPAHKMLQNGEYKKAAELLKPYAEKENDDQLVYLLDYGIAEHLAGDYESSNKAFLKAHDLADIQDYHSLSRITGSLLLNEGMVQYKGEDFEKVLINAYLAMNFLMMGELESALVETRRINEKLIKFKEEAKRNYSQNPFARYLSAMIWEQDRKWDDAYIDYVEAFNINPNIPGIGEDLIRSARRAGRPQEVQKWKNTFPGSRVDRKWFDRNNGEIVLLYKQGNGPIKRPNPNFRRVPKLYRRNSYGQSAKLEVIDGPSAETRLIFNIEESAIKTLDDLYAGLVAKRIAGLAAKAAVSNEIRKKNQFLGDLAWIGFNIADQADLRQWSTLPATLQVARLVVPAGEYTVRARSLDSSGSPSGEYMPEKKVKVVPRKKTFIIWRSFR